MLNDNIPTVEFDPKNPQPCGKLTGAVKSLGSVYGLNPIRRGKYKHRVEVVVLKDSGYATVIVHPLSIEIEGADPE